MVQATTVLNGWLQTRTGRVAVSARYASRFSLWVEMDGRRLDSGIANLHLLLGDQLVDVGLCRLLDDGSEHRLVSLARDRDFRKLFFGSPAERHEAAPDDLHEVLTSASRVDPGFREFVAGMTYELNVLCGVLDRVDADCRDEPPQVREKITENAIATLAPQLNACLDRRLPELARRAGGLGAGQREAHRLYLRSQMWNLLLRAPVIAHTILETNGAAPDSGFLRMIYHDSLQGETTFGRILHRYVLGQPIARAIRARRSELVTLLGEHAGVRADSPADLVDVLSVGCDPAVEIADTLKLGRGVTRIHFTLLDQDEEALLETAWLIGEARRLWHTEVLATYVREPAAALRAGRQPGLAWGRFHLIYAKAMFDYLTTPQAAALLRSLYDLLRPGGRVVIWALRESAPGAAALGYLQGWNVVTRSRDDLYALTKGLPGARVTLHDDETGAQTRVVVDKAGE